MKNFIQDIKKSIWGGDYLADFGNRSFGSAFKFVLLISVIVTIVTAITSVFVFLPIIDEYINQEELKQLVIDHVPADLVVTIENGVLSTNSEAPVAIENFFPGEDSNNDFDFTNFIVINPAETNPLDNIGAYDTFLLVTDTQVLGVNENSAGQVRVFNLTPDGETHVITQETLLAGIDEWLPIAKNLIRILALLFIPLGFVGAIIGHMFMALFYALLINIIAWCKKIQIGYKRAYIIALFGLGLVLVLRTLFSFVGLGAYTTLIWILFVVMVFNNLKSKDVVETMKASMTKHVFGIIFLVILILINIGGLVLTLVSTQKDFERTTTEQHMREAAAPTTFEGILSQAQVDAYLTNSELPVQIKDNLIWDYVYFDENAFVYEYVIPGAPDTARVEDYIDTNAFIQEQNLCTGSSLVLIENGIEYIYSFYNGFDAPLGELYVSGCGEEVSN